MKGLFIIHFERFTKVQLGTYPSILYELFSYILKGFVRGCIFKIPFSHLFIYPLFFTMYSLTSYCWSESRTNESGIPVANMACVEGKPYSSMYLKKVKRQKDKFRKSLPRYRLSNLNTGGDRGRGMAKTSLVAWPIYIMNAHRIESFGTIVPSTFHALSKMQVREE